MILYALLLTLLPGSVSGQEAEKPDLLQKALGAMNGAEEIVFVVRGFCAAPQPTVTFGRYADEPLFTHAPDGSRLCKLNLRTRKVTVLLDDPKGNIRDPRVHYDGGKILFAYRKGGTQHYNLYEINTDGSGFRQLTFGEWDDIDPAYLPDGGIIFVSSRGNRFIPCNRVPAAHHSTAWTPTAATSSAFRPTTSRDDRPAVLPDGRIIYTRWEYVDRDPEKFRDLWVMNPDGTGQMVLFGGTGRPYRTVLRQVRCPADPRHGRQGRVGLLAGVRASRKRRQRDGRRSQGRAGRSGPRPGRSAPRSAEYSGSGASALGRGARDFAIPIRCPRIVSWSPRTRACWSWMATGKTQEFYRAEKMVHDPRVIRPRPREPVIPPRIDLRKTTGRLVLADVYRGRNMEGGVKPGTIKKLLVLEDLPKPVSYYSSAGADQHGRHAHAPPGSGHRSGGARRVGFVRGAGAASGSISWRSTRRALAVKRMQSYTMVMPGETQGCVGCHEPRTETPGPAVGSTLMALKRPPSRIEPVAGVPDVFDYPRDIQPIWDRHCVTCHSAEKPVGTRGAHGRQQRVVHAELLRAVRLRPDQRHVRRIDGGRQPSALRFRHRSQPADAEDRRQPLRRETDASRNTTRCVCGSRRAPYFAGTYAVYNHSGKRGRRAALANIPKREPIGSTVGPIVYNRCLCVPRLGRVDGPASARAR